MHFGVVMDLVFVHDVSGCPSSFDECLRLPQSVEDVSVGCLVLREAPLVAVMGDRGDLFSATACCIGMLRLKSKVCNRLLK
jgi:hypothetical protein